MAFTLPDDLPTNWADNVGMIEDADYLNAIGEMNNALKAALLGTVNNTSQAVVATQEQTTSTSYVDLTTTTDTVTVTIGPSGMAIVTIYAAIYNADVGGISYMSYAMSGNNTAAASDTQCVNAQIAAGCQNAAAFSGTFFLAGLATGSTTFKLKYRASAGTAKFTNRRIVVIPFF